MQYFSNFGKFPILQLTILMTLIRNMLAYQSRIKKIKKHYTLKREQVFMKSPQDVWIS